MPTKKRQQCSTVIAPVSSPSTSPVNPFSSSQLHSSDLPCGDCCPQTPNGLVHCQDVLPSTINSPQTLQHSNAVRQLYRIFYGLLFISLLLSLLPTVDCVGLGLSPHKRQTPQVSQWRSASPFNDAQRNSIQAEVQSASADDSHTVRIRTRESPTGQQPAQKAAQPPPPDPWLYNPLPQPQPQPQPPVYPYGYYGMYAGMPWGFPNTQLVGYGPYPAMPPQQRQQFYPKAQRRRKNGGGGGGGRRRRERKLAKYGKCPKICETCTPTGHSRGKYLS